MSTAPVTPYSRIGENFQIALNSIIESLPSNPSIDNLVEAVNKYIRSFYYKDSDNKQLKIEIKSVSRNSVNSYINNLILEGKAGYGFDKIMFLNQLLNANSIDTRMSVKDIILEAEANIINSQLSDIERTPLLLSTTICSNVNSYWSTVSDKTDSLWHSYMNNTNDSIVYWSVATITGSLAGYNSKFDSPIEPCFDYATNKMVSAIIGALTVTVGKIIFNWNPKIQHINTLAYLNALEISALNSKTKDGLYAGAVHGNTYSFCVFHKGQSACPGNCSGSQDSANTGCGANTNNCT